MLNDSWEVAAILDNSESGFPRLSIGRRILHDLFSMAICIGGLVMIWVTNIDPDAPPPTTAAERHRNNLIMGSLWITLAVG